MFVLGKARGAESFRGILYCRTEKIMKRIVKCGRDFRGKGLKGGKLLAAAFLCLAFCLSGCSSMGDKSPYPEVETYLKNRYGGKFQIELMSGEGEEASYRVMQKDGEKLEFEVYPVGEEYTDKGFDDTLPMAFVLKKAGELDLFLEPGEGEKELVATIEGYKEIEGLAEKLAQIADAYKEADLPAKFTRGTVGDGWNSANIRVEIQGFAPEGYQPGVIRIPDSVTGFHDKESMQQYLETNYLMFLERYFLGEIPADVPEEELQAVRKDTNGITVINGDETREYPDFDINNLYFAQVYRMAQKEGWEPAADGNCFTLARGEENYRFELVFEEREDLKDREKHKYSGSVTPLGHAFSQRPVVYWSKDGEEGRAIASSEFAGDEETEILERITGVEIESGLKLQMAQERVREIQQEVEGYLLRSDVKSFGDRVEIKGWGITLNQAEEKKRLESSTMYFEADEDKVFAYMDMDVENLGAEKTSFLSMIGTNEDLMVHLITSGGHRYIPVDLIGMSDLASASVEPGEVKNGGLIFHIGEGIMQEDEHVFLSFKAGEESRVFRIK